VKNSKKINKTNQEKGQSQTQLGKLLDRFKIKVSDHEFKIEIFNQDMSDEDLKKYSVLVDGKPYTVEVESLGIDSDEGKFRDAGGPVTSPMARPVSESGTGLPAKLTQTSTTSAVDQSEENVLTAPMPGTILQIKVQEGDTVEAGQPLVILEAMKMENVMTAPASGIVKEIPIQVGNIVTQGDILVLIE
jgi:biotin carboxyl carrier protein